MENKNTAFSFMPAFIFLLALLMHGQASSEELIPKAENTKLLRGQVEEKSGMRTVYSTVDLKKTHGHGPITWYTLPFQEGTISFDWKLEHEGHILFVADGPINGKATHSLKVFINRKLSSIETSPDLTIITYDGSTKEKKRVQKYPHRYFANEGQWHHFKVTLEDQVATIDINQQTYQVKSKKFVDGFTQFGIMHSTTLHTKNLKVHQNR